MTMGNSVKTWYRTQLKKHPWTPPPFMFPLTWSFLYVTMGYAAYRVTSLPPTTSGLKWSTYLYGTQLVLNFAWTPLFFKFKQFGWALADIVTLWCTIAATTVSFYQLDPVAGMCMVPYLGWVGYASVLNHYAWKHNPGFRNLHLKKK